MGLLKEFKEFAVKGNLVDIAVGFVMGATFTKIVTSFETSQCGGKRCRRQCSNRC